MPSTIISASRRSSFLGVRRREDTDLRAVTVKITRDGKQKARDAGATMLAIPDFDYRQWEISTESQRSLTRAWERLAGKSEG